MFLVSEVDAKGHQPDLNPNQDGDEDADHVVAGDDGQAVSNGFVDLFLIHWFPFNKTARHHERCLAVGFGVEVRFGLAGAS